MITSYSNLYDTVKFNNVQEEVTPTRNAVISNENRLGINQSTLNGGLNYTLEQKLRNNGLYSKMKNKINYSSSEFVVKHSTLNSL